MMWLLVACALVFSSGVWIVAAAFWPPPPDLAGALQRLHSPGTPRRAVVIPSTAPDTGVTVRTGRWALRVLTDGPFSDDQTQRDLAVLRRPAEVYAGVCVLAAIAGVGAGPAVWAVVAAIGTELPLLVPVWLAALGAVAGFFLPRMLLRAEATRARTDFRHALGAYLDLLVLLLAANEGPEGAMETAARAGSGPAFQELRRATLEARLSGYPVWDGLDELGRRLGVAELSEVAAAGNLAGERGAAVRRSLMAKARALRSSTLAAAETAARARSQAMFAPIVLMGMGFISFLLYPLITNLQLGT